ncbi:hypothetical protein ACOI1C_06165 [Bacillus sp. DJP31]|uniref:hypothetical protein n=1 Tax=Bacillus sp. DJP31 TaxID=3409789 RepID=UPI003BB6D9FA
MKKDIRTLDILIHQVHINNSATGQVKTKTKGQVEKKANPLQHSLNLLVDKDFDALKGTRINYREVTNSEDVIEFLETHSDTAVLKYTTVLDLKLLFYILTGERMELKGKKEDMLLDIKRNIRARKRGEAFTKTI